MGHDDHTGILIEGVIDGGKNGPDSSIVRDIPGAVEGNVEIEPE